MSDPLHILTDLERPPAPLAEAYPDLGEALAWMRALAEMTPSERDAYWTTLDEHALVHGFVIANAPRLLYEDVIRPALNREAQDRFLSRGTSLEPALRAHASERPNAQALVREARGHTELLRPAPEWRRELDRAVAAHDQAAAQLAETEAHYQHERDWLAWISRAARRITAPPTRYAGFTRDGIAGDAFVPASRATQTSEMSQAEQASQQASQN